MHGKVPEDLLRRFVVLKKCRNKFDCLVHEMLFIRQLKPKGPVIRATFSCNLSRNKVAAANWDCLLRVLPPSLATNFHVAESRCRFYFLQHKNLLRKKVVIRATNNHNLQRQHCCATSCTKMLPVSVGLNLNMQSDSIRAKVFAWFFIFAPSVMLILAPTLLYKYL